MKPENKVWYRPEWIAFLLSCILLAGSSCQQVNEKRESNQVVVNKHLQEGYERSTNYSRMYDRFVIEAGKERNRNIADLFAALARSEGIRATNHAKLLLARGIQPAIPQAAVVAVGNVRQMLKMAMSSENIQYYDLYPTALKAALAEKDTAAIAEFQASDQLDERHRELINEAINQLERNPKAVYSICDRCGYIFTSGQKTECPICQKFKALYGKV